MSGLDRLCDLCESFNISACDFLPPKQRPPGFEAIPSGCRMKLGVIQEVAKRERCPLCRWVTETLQSSHLNVFTRNNRIDPVTGYETDEPITCALFFIDKPPLGSSEWKSGDRPRLLAIKCSSILHVSTYLALHVDNALMRGSTTSQYYARDRGDFRAKVNMISSWIHTCVNVHGADCMRLPTPDQWDSPQVITFIDVQERCLVNLSILNKYIALSYVWGQEPFFRATKATDRTLRRKGGLSAFRIPKTVEDAITLTHQLGIRYLWVDCLCITQDEDEHKQHLIAMMDTIYSSAVLTIVALDGPSANSGIFKDQYNVEQNSVQLSSQLKLVAVSTGSRQKSVHETRAWTYQERLLSKRQVLFAQDLIYFVCQKAHWREDMVSEASLTTGVDPFRPFWGALHTGRHQKRTPGFYGQCVIEYTRRQMTHEDDVLRAFNGISRVLEGQLQTKFKFGIPMALLDWALLWRDGGDIRPRSGFPSWSWAGWVGPVDLLWGAASAPSLCSHTWIQWHIDEEEKLHSISRSSLVQLPEKPRHYKDEQEHYRQYFRSVLRASVETPTFSVLGRLEKYRPTKVPMASGTPVRDGQLRGFTVSAFFKIEPHVASPDRLEPRKPVLRDRLGNQVGFLSYGDPDRFAEVLESPTRLQEIIILSGRFAPEDNGHGSTKFRSILGDQVPDPNMSYLRLLFLKECGEDVNDVIADMRVPPKEEKVVNENPRYGEASYEPSSPRPTRKDATASQSLKRKGENSGNLTDGGSGVAVGGDDTDGTYKKTRRKAGNSEDIADPRNWKSYNILAIDWCEGVAKRKAIGSLLQEAVENAFEPGPVWKEIVLG